MNEEQPEDDAASQQAPESQQQADDELAFPDLKAGNAWGESITKQRAAQLEAILQAWESEQEHDRFRGAFDKKMSEQFGEGVPLTGADVFWLAAQAIEADKASDIAAREQLFVKNYRLDRLPSLANAHLQGANLTGAHLEGSYLCGIHLEGAKLDEAHLEGSILGLTHERDHTRLHELPLDSFPEPAHLEGASLRYAHLEDAILSGTGLQGADCRGATFDGAFLERAVAQDAIFAKASLQGAQLRLANLLHAIFDETHLEQADFTFAHLEKARFVNATLEGANLNYARLNGADLRGAYFDRGTVLSGIALGDETLGYVSVADVRWGDVNLAAVDWTRTQHSFLGIFKRVEAIELGDVKEALIPIFMNEIPKDKQAWIHGYKSAVRANRQLATVLRSQGLNEDADRFAYKAQKLQREVLRREGQWLRWLGSLLLDIIAGYGYRPLRAFGAYAFVIALFTGLYLLNSHFVSPHLTWNEALVLSMSSFHGRGFFNPNIQLGDTYAQFAAVEALVGLLIEITFIATFTQRFFAR